MAERMAKLRADPEAFAAWKAKVCPAIRSPEAIRKHVASLAKNRAWRRNVASAGRRHMRLLNTDADAMERRAAAALAAVPGRVLRNAERLAVRVGIPVGLVAEFRFMRWRKHYSEAEAIAVLRAEHPAAFVAVDAERLKTAVRAAGPAPAIGAPTRAAWTRTVNHAVRSLVPPPR